MATNKELKKKAENSENTLVEIELFRDNRDYKDDVFVAVNGESCVIARGKKVKVKKKFAQKLINFLRFHSSFFLLFLSPWESDLRKHRYNLCQRVLCPCSFLGVL